MDVDADQRWNTHLQRLVRTLDRSLFHIRRLAGQISEKGLKKVTDSIWTSKLSHGLQLISEVRTCEAQSKSTDVHFYQKAQS